MRKSLDPFRAVPLLDLEERIECLACTSDAIYVGTSVGNLVQFDLILSPGATEDLAALAGAAKRKASVKLSPRRAVEQVLASPGVVFALADGALRVLPSDIGSSSGKELCKDAKRFCLHTGVAADSQGQSRFPEVCVSFKRKLVLYAHNGRSYEQRQGFDIAEAACTMAWHQSWICVGLRREYTLFNDRNGLQHEVTQLDGKFTPQIAVAASDELLLLIQENVGLFMSLSTQPPSASAKVPVQWARKVVNIGAAGPYIIGSLAGGQVEVFGVRDQKICQTLTLEGNTVAVTTLGDRILVATEGAVTCLDPIPFDQQMQKLLRQVRVADALCFLNANFGPDHQQREEQLARFHTLAGWALFQDLEFKGAFQHFLYTPDLNVVRILDFWRKHVPSEWDGMPGAGRPSPPGGALEAQNLEDFVKARLQEKGDSASVAGTVGVAHAALVAFLLRQREALRVQERQPKEDRAYGQGCELEPLLCAVDTVLLKLLIESSDDDAPLQKFLGAQPRCAIKDCESFLHERSRFDVTARLQKAQGQYGLALKEWNLMLAGDNGVPRVRVPEAEVVAEMVEALCSASDCANGADLLQKYVPELLARKPAAVLKIFTSEGQPGGAGSCPLSADQVLVLLNAHDTLVLSYLEHLAQRGGEVETSHRSKLALIYISQVAEEQKAGEKGAPMTPMRQKLIRFLENTDEINAHALLPQVDAMQLREEKVVLHYREQRHQEALRVLVLELDDLPRAEVYCHVVTSRGKRRSRSAAGEEVSIFCEEPPTWARGACAFISKSPTAPMPDLPGDRDDHSDDAAVGSQQEPTGDAGKDQSGLLMLFLRVLLDASVGAKQAPEEHKRAPDQYQEAALSLLMAYAGHGDLPADEVVGLLPEGWPLATLAPYLCKSVRFGLHEKRASMLEENVSAMAYLKTFRAWSFERSRKVQITGDRCCPVCNRRFVDKDSVGKAFIAYPNETCVHLQCKKDLSICPKTGRNFSDNTSVYCHALGMESIG